jgi:hypothetical protein
MPVRGKRKSSDNDGSEPLIINWVLLVAEAQAKKFLIGRACLSYSAVVYRFAHHGGCLLVHFC